MSASNSHDALGCKELSTRTIPCTRHEPLCEGKDVRQNFHAVMLFRRVMLTFLNEDLFTFFSASAAVCPATTCRARLLTATLMSSKPLGCQGAAA